MIAKLDLKFDQFSSGFVHAYWSAVKDGTFSMPPNEPVEESLEELISADSYRIDRKTSRNKNVDEYTLIMRGEMGAWWMFGFCYQGGMWNLLTASARSDKKGSPHNLLGAVYRPYFQPLLDYVTSQANNRSEQDAASNP